eukprot:scaffold2910_cov390-Prasinococcus_capsulatus_cf.AAC.35
MERAGADSGLARPEIGAGGLSGPPGGCRSRASGRRWRQGVRRKYTRGYASAAAPAPQFVLARAPRPARDAAAEDDGPSAHPPALEFAARIRNEQFETQPEREGDETLTL